MTSSNLVLRPADLADLDDLVALEEEVFAGESVQIDRRQWRYLLTRASTAVVIVVRAAGAGAGAGANRQGPLAGALVLGHRPGGRSLRIVSLGVAAHSRRRGVARRLLRHALDHARRHGLETIHLEVRSDNHAARALYRKFGFAEVAELPDYYEPGEHGLRMERATG